MVEQVIGYFPGGGGNRYLRYLQNAEYQKLGISYDNLIPNQCFTWRYLQEQTVTGHQPVLLTHCVNERLIRQKIETVKKIFILDFPLQDCLRREWSLAGKQRYIAKNQLVETDYTKKIECYEAIRDTNWPVVTNYQDYELLPSVIKCEVEKNYQKVMQNNLDQIEFDSAWETISWHKSYYSQYPMQTDRCSVIRLDQDTMFSQIMIEELSRYQNDIFDQAWAQIMKSNV